ncbi:MAG: UDP-N-acetylmuramate--L-alanine ligase [Bacteroidetes bacterium]|nr:UDP-N-acetylmuramate--L-alanine ligase [Bacteroidota bacterium]
MHNAYFIGIGGIGMSAMARYFKAHGTRVAGYDGTATELTKQLGSESIDIHFSDDTLMIPVEFRNPVNTLVVYTPAVPMDHTELKWFIKHRFTVRKRSEVLGMITREAKAIAVAGTHGKTTVSTLIAHLLKTSEVGCTAFMGGISKNYGSNLLLSDKSDIIVVEADEYDRSFLHLAPQIAVITSVDADHLDVYGTLDEVMNAFHSFTDKIRAGGTLLVNRESGFVPRSGGDRDTWYYSITGKADFYAKNIKITDSRYRFNIATPSGELKNLESGMPGTFNVGNAVAAVAAAVLAGAKEAEIRKGLKSFQGIRRRFDFIIRRDDLVFIDDYAHHPVEIRACISAVREIFPGKRITGIFQPHLFTRTRDFAKEFSESLGMLDELILLEIYPAREKPLKGISSRLLLSGVNLKDKIFCSAKDLPELIGKKRIEVLLTMGAGDIDRLVDPLKKVLLGNNRTRKK